ncbi:MAG: FAD-dependent monooxygenase [Hyphomicrobiaceae bacterium]
MAGPAGEDERFDLIIGGGGFAGMALARAIAGALGEEVRIAIVDRPPPVAAAEDVRASAISAGSANLLGAIGVWPAVTGEAQPVSRIEIGGARVESPVRPVLLDYDNHTREGEPASYILMNRLLHAALSRAVRAEPGITLVSGEAAVGFEAGEALAEVRLASGRRLTAPLVVASEGRRSALREAAGIKTVGWSYGQSGIVTTVRHERPHEGVAVQHFLPAGPFAILPLPGGLTSSLVWSERTETAERMMRLGDGDFLAEVAQRFGGRRGEITLEGPRMSWPLEMHMSRSFVGPRIALLGDAARGVHPIAGQGLNLALRDVAALAEVVSDTMRLGLDPGGATALARYQRWRRFDSVVSAGAMDGINRLFSNDNSLLRAVRETGLRLVDRAPGLKRLIVEEAAGLVGDVPKLLKGLPV